MWYNKKKNSNNQCNAGKKERKVLASTVNQNANGLKKTIEKSW